MSVYAEYKWALSTGDPKIIENAEIDMRSESIRASREDRYDDYDDGEEDYGEE